MDDLSSLLSLSMARKSVQFCCWGFGQPGGLELHWEMYVEIPHRLIPIAQRWWIVPNKSQKKTHTTDQVPVDLLGPRSPWYPDAKFSKTLNASSALTCLRCWPLIAPSFFYVPALNMPCMPKYAPGFAHTLLT